MKLQSLRVALPPTWDGAMLARIVEAIPGDWTHATGRLVEPSPGGTSPHAPGVEYVVYDDVVEVAQASDASSRVHLACVLLGRLRVSCVRISDVGPARFQLAKDLASRLYRDGHRGRMVFLDRRAPAGEDTRRPYLAEVEIDGDFDSVRSPGNSTPRSRVPTVALYLREDASPETMAPISSVLRDVGAIPTSWTFP